MSYTPQETEPMEKLAIDCIFYVAEKEGLTPEEVLWGLVPMENRHIVSDTSQYEEDTKTTRSSRQPDTEDHSVSRRAC
jgi:hypothetical protein